MGKADIAAKNYLQDNEVFADVFNYYLFQGEQQLKPEELCELDSAQTAQLTRKNLQENPQKRTNQNTTMNRDLLKNAVIRTDGDAYYVLHLGLEPQSWIDYAMPIRAGAYDFGEYKKQLRHIVKGHKKNRDNAAYSKRREHRRDEYLSGFYKTDKLIPVITLVLYLGPDKWDGPMSLHEMLAETDPRLLKLVADYRLNLITPEAVSNTELQLFQTNLREVIGCIKYSGDREQLENYVTDNPRMDHLDVDAARLIAATTKTEISIPEESEEINMCKAIDDMKRISREEGIKEERTRLTIETARRMFENGIVYDIVRACTDQLVPDQTLREIQASVLSAQKA